MRRSRLLRAATAMLALTTLFGAAPAVAEPAPALSWTPCGDRQGECATVSVPVDHAEPGGARMDVAIGRLPATAPAKRIGVLFIAPGGPGASGIDSYVLAPGKIQDMAALRERFDIVSWDQRGVKRSSEVRCSTELLDQAPGAFPADEAEYRRLLDYNARLGEDCRRHTGPVFDHVDTASAVRDLDAIRAALGEEQLSFYGASYGTQVGQQYAELFPDRVRAMTIDSNMDHSMTSGARYIETATEDLEGSFNAFADWCRRTADCALHDRDVRVVWDDMHARAEAGDLTDPADGSKLSAEDLRGELMHAMYRPEERWYALADWFRALSQGSPAPAAAAAPAELAENSYQAIWCDDWKWNVGDFAELRRYREQAEAAGPHTKLSPFWSDVTACLGWPAEVSNPQHRLSIQGAPPVLIVKGRHDVATPHAWNLAVADQIENSVLLDYDGIGHGQYNRSDCVSDRVNDYLVMLRTPAPGTHCEAVWPTTPPPPAVRSAAPDTHTA